LLITPLLVEVTAPNASAMTTMATKKSKTVENSREGERER